jgi:beta-glucanase (GH16 family)
MKRSKVLLSILAGVWFVPAGYVRAEGPPPGYRLVWSDEFDYQGQPDAAKWGYEEGFVRNKELQYYTRDRRENARVEHGMLVIEGRKERFRNPRFDPRHGPKGEYAEYTSASLITLHKASWLYGRIELRAKLPHGKGVWPAIWMLGANFPEVNWPACGEIDIMEFVGHTPNQVHATVHYPIGGKHKSSHKELAVEKPWGDFHVYAMEWTPDRMDFYFDRTRYHSFEVKRADESGGNPFRRPQYLLVNLALGGGWGGPLDDAVLPQQFLVDYVRVYQKASVAVEKTPSPK